MEVENFKEQQQDRIEEGKDLKREDELTDLSQIPSKQLPGAENKSLLTKISEGISNVASVISDKVGYNPVIEGHEDLDRDVKKQVKKINKEILKQATDKGSVEEKVSEWETALPKQVKKEVEGTKDDGEGLVRKLSQKVDEIKDSGDLTSATTIQPNRDGPSPLDKINEQYDNVASKVEETVVPQTNAKEGTSLLGKIQQGVQGVTEKISHGVDGLKQRFGGEKQEESTERTDDGTKVYRNVNDGFNETVDDLKQEKRVEEFGEQKELNSENPFKSLDSGSDNKEEGETRTLGEKVKGSVNDAGNKITTKVGEVSQKVKSTFAPKAPVDKENTQQIA